MCVVRSRALRRADHSRREVLPTVAHRCVWSSNLVKEEAIARAGLQSHKKNTSFLSGQSVPLMTNFHGNHVYVRIYMFVPHITTTCLLKCASALLVLVIAIKGAHLAYLANLFFKHCLCAMSLKPKALTGCVCWAQARGQGRKQWSHSKQQQSK
jgi:hypothetical protein